MKKVIECKNVWKIYNQGTPAEVRALQGVDLEIEQGELVSIMGSSGSGKSTLLNCIGCLDVPTKGKCFIDGEDISQLNEQQLAMIRRKKIGFIFQFYNLIPNLTAMGNIELPMVFNGLEEEERKKRAKQLLEDVGLGKRLHHRPAELSGGETQRVAIARSLANDPVVVLADEPTGNLDSKSGKEIVNIFHRLNKANRTIVIVTHDQKIAEQTDRMIKIVDGKIVGR